MKKQKDTQYHVDYRNDHYKRIEIYFDKNDEQLLEWLNEKGAKSQFIRDIIKQEFRNDKGYPNKKDCEKIFGYKLRWLNGGGDEDGNVWKYRYFIEDLNSGERTEILNPKVIKFIEKESTSKFRNDTTCYESYKKLNDLIRKEGIDGKEGN